MFLSTYYSSVIVCCGFSAVSATLWYGAGRLESTILGPDFEAQIKKQHAQKTRAKPIKSHFCVKKKETGQSELLFERIRMGLVDWR